MPLVFKNWRQLGKFEAYLSMPYSKEIHLTNLVRLRYTNSSTPTLG